MEENLSTNQPLTLGYMVEPTKKNLKRLKFLKINPRLPRRLKKPLKGMYFIVAGAFYVPWSVVYIKRDTKWKRKACNFLRKHDQGIVIMSE